MIVDAATGKLLYRQNLVDYLADNPTWLAPAALDAVQRPERVPVELPDHGHRAALLLDGDRRLHDVVASDNPATTVYPMGVASKFPWDVQLDRRRAPTSARRRRRRQQRRRRPGVERRTTASTATRLSSARRARPATTSRRSRTPGTRRAATRTTSTPRSTRPATTSRPRRSPSSSATTSCTTARTTSASTRATGTPSSTTTASRRSTRRRRRAARWLLPLGNDGLIGNAQSGAATGSRDNANMGTGADGQHPTTNQFVWQPLAGSFYAPCVDGAYDFTVFGHEFGHLIENRMIGKGVGARQGNAAGAMGEAFGDFDALAALNELHLPVPAGADRYTEGAYATGNRTTASATSSRAGRWAASSRSPARIPTPTRSTTATSASTSSAPRCTPTARSGSRSQIDLRDLFLARYPSPGAATDIACARGQIAPTTCPGDRRWIQDYYDAMVMMPRNPTMIQARDAMLAADLARFGGANQDLLWQGFAMRGFGQHQNTVSNADTDPVPDFSSPLANNATLNFFADTKDEGRAVPVKAKIYVGDYQARVDADRGHQPGDDHRPARTRRATSTTRRSSCRTRAELAGGWEAVDVQLHRGRTRLRARPLQREEPASRARPGTSRSTSRRTSRRRRRARRSPATRSGRTRTSANLIDDNEADERRHRPARRSHGRWVVIKLGDVDAGGNDQAARRLGAARAGQQPLHGAALVRRVRVHARARTRRTRPATARSTPAGRRSSRRRPTRSRRSTRGPGTPDMTLRYFDASADRRRRTSSSW